MRQRDRCPVGSEQVSLTFLCDFSTRDAVYVRLGNAMIVTMGSLKKNSKKFSLVHIFSGTLLRNVET